jgi:hypothetical protein
MCDEWNAFMTILPTSLAMMFVCYRFVKVSELITGNRVHSIENCFACISCSNHIGMYSKIKCVNLKEIYVTPMGSLYREP